MNDQQDSSGRWDDSSFNVERKVNSLKNKLAIDVTDHFLKLTLENLMEGFNY